MDLVKEYIFGWLQLDRMNDEEHSSDGADLIRDKMDAVYDKMSEEDHQVVYKFFHLIDPTSGD